MLDSIFAEIRRFFRYLSVSFYFSKKILIITIVTGIITGLGAALFNFTLDKSIEIFNNIVASLKTPYFIALIPALGGIIVGVMKYVGGMSFDVPCATDAMIDAVKSGGYVPAKIPFLQLITASITIGSGGSCGRECPTAYIGTGFGSISYSILKKFGFEKLFKFELTEKDRRLLGICGAASGLGAIFRAPIGSALFSAEVLYRYGLEFTAILPAFVSAIVSYLVFSVFYPYEPLFKMKSVWGFGVTGVIFTIITGIFSAIVGWLYVKIFYGVYRISRRSSLPDWIKPAIGGFLEGLIVALIAKEVWGMGYDVIQNAINGKFALSFMVALILLKILATSFTVATGGSGGVIAPSLFIGAMMGASLGKVFLSITHVKGSVGIYAVVGMSSLYAAVGKVPIALPILILEATRNLSLVLPLFVASSIGYLFSGPFTLYESQSPFMTKESLAFDVAGETELDILAPFKVKRIMSVDLETIPEDARLSDVLKTFKESDHIFFPVVGKDMKYIGSISLSDVRPLFMEEELDPLILASDIANTSIPAVDPNDSLKDAYITLERYGLDYLPVVSKGKLVGVLSKRDINKLLRRELVTRVGSV